jgi:Rieske 2Fe-2S family protein
MARVSAFSSTLPGRYYHAQDVFALEQDRVFGATWVCVGRAERVEAAGRFLNVPIGGERVLVVRGRDGVLRGMLNVCRHRGSRLCTEAEGQLRGSIQCRYHAWTYGLDGSLVGAPHAMGEEGFDRERFGLVPVALEEWEGFVWCHLAGADAPPLAAQLADQRLGRYPGLARYRIGELRAGASITYDVAANWKLVLENFSECCHCAPIHPELVERLPAYRGGAIDPSGEGARFAPGLEAFSMSGKRARPPLPGLEEADRARYIGLILLPNLLLNLLPDHVVAHTLWPEAPDRTRVVCEWLFHPDAVAAPGFDPGDAVELFDRINKQDWEASEGAQQGVSSRSYRDGGLLMPLEHEVRLIGDFVRARLGA